MRRVVWVFLALGVLWSTPAFAVCDQTFTTASSNATIAAAIKAAPNDTTICLDSGTYAGNMDVFSGTRTGYVTITSTTGRGAILKPRIGAMHYTRWTELTFTGVLVNSCSRHNQFINFTMVEASGQGFDTDGSTCLTTDLDLLIDGGTFHRVSMGVNTGGLNFKYVRDTQLTNSTFTGGGDTGADYIQFQGNSTVEIGPNNSFSGLLQADCSVSSPGSHCDAIQIAGSTTGYYWFHGNYFANGDTFILAPDRTGNILIEDNVFNGCGVAYAHKFQVNPIVGAVIRHNTFADVRVSVDSKLIWPASEDVLAENNIIYDCGSNSETGWKTIGGNGCIDCTFRYTLAGDVDAYLTDTNCTNCSFGTGDIVATPVFVGGATPNTWAGWELAAASPGDGAATDGFDIGSRFVGGEVDIPGVTPGTPANRGRFRR